MLDLSNCPIILKRPSCGKTNKSNLVMSFFSSAGSIYVSDIGFELDVSETASKVVGRDDPLISSKVVSAISVLKCIYLTNAPNKER